MDYVGFEEKLGVNRIGTISELKACAWLLEQGYSVFRNVSHHGMIDIVALKADEILYLDVKTGHGKLSHAQYHLGVKMIIVAANGNCRIANDYKPHKTLLVPKLPLRPKNNDI